MITIKENNVDEFFEKFKVFENCKNLLLKYPELISIDEENSKVYLNNKQLEYKDCVELVMLASILANCFESKEDEVEENA